MGHEQPTVYLAGPQVFDHPGRFYVEKKLKPAVEEAGCEPVFPLELGTEDEEEEIAAIAAQPPSPDRAESYHEWSRTIGQYNAEAVENEDIILANLDGPAVDPGTSAEATHASLLGKPVIGYRTDARQAGENTGVLVNLQLEHYIRESGGTLIGQDPFGGSYKPEGYRFFNHPDALLDELTAELEEIAHRLEPE